MKKQCERYKASAKFLKPEALAAIFYYYYGSFL